MIKENEKSATCSLGVVIAHENYLNKAKNRDLKKSFSATGLRNIWWLLKDHPYPPNFWEFLPREKRDAIMSAGGGTARVAALFKNSQRMAISRQVVQGIAQQDDYMKRVRRNGGARDVLAPQGIAILWGQNDRALIKKLGLGDIGADEFISYAPRTPEEIDLLRKAGHID